VGIAIVGTSFITSAKPASMAKAAIGDTFQLVTSSSSLSAGDLVTIGSASTGSGYFISTSMTSNGYYMSGTTAITISNSQIISTSTAEEFTLGGSSGSWTFHTTKAATSGYLNATSGYTDLKIVTINDAYGVFSISSNAQTITATGKATKNIIEWYASSSYFSTYTTGTVYIFKKVAATSYDPVTGISLSSSSGTYSVMGGDKITATISPSTANPGVSWTSSDEFVATASGGTIYAVGAGTATITAITIGTNASGSSLTATFSVTVNSFGIADLRDSTGAIAHSGSIVAVTGTTTKIVVGSGLYIQTGSGSSARAVYGYSTSVTSTSAIIGKLCTVKGTIYNFNGQLELNNASFKSSSADGETITPWVLSPSDFTTANLTGHDSVEVTASPLVLTAIPGTLVYGSSGSDTTISGSFGSTAVSLFAGKYAVSSADDTTINTFFSKLGTAGTFSFTGVLGWHSAPQFALIAAGDIVTEGTTDADFAAVQSFVDKYMHMADNIDDQCLAVYPAAHTAFIALSVKQQGILSTSTYATYSAAYKRYVAWGIGYAAGQPASQVLATNSNNTSLTMVGLLGVVILVSCGFFFYKKKHV